MAKGYVLHEGPSPADADANLKRALEQLGQNEAAVAEAINEARAEHSRTEPPLTGAEQHPWLALLQRLVSDAPSSTADLGSRPGLAGPGHRLHGR